MTPPRLHLRLRRAPPRPLVLAAAGARAAIDAPATAPAPRAGQAIAAAHLPLAWEYHSQGGPQAVRHRRVKTVRLGASRAPAAPIQLYDLQVDPGEQHDVASAHPREAARLTQMLRELRTRSPIARFDFGAAAQP
jgi:arylsulfatase A